MRRRPFMILVCLGLLLLSLKAGIAEEYIDVVIQPSHSREYVPAFYDSSKETESPELREAAARPRLHRNVVAPRFPMKEITKCKPLSCAPELCPPAPCKPACNLPRRGLGQWELAVQVFFARVRGTVKQGAYAGGLVPATSIDFSGDLGLPSQGVFLDYSARFQFAPSWALSYAIMPIELEANKTAERNLYYRQWLIPYGSRIHTKWDFTYQRVGLIYQPIVTCSAVVSVYGGWLFNDESTRLYNYVCSGHGAVASRTRNMVTSGLEIQKCITTKCTGATLSCDNRVGLSYLDGCFGLDVQAGLRYSVPMGIGHWGYARGGYRYLTLGEDRNDLRLDAVLEGGFVEAGLIF